MSLTIDIFLQQSLRIQRVVEYMGAHLDDGLRLGDLAELACLSPSHFDRLYRARLSESPMATLRRLRLTRALERLTAEPAYPITELAFDAGYGSRAAFTHACLRQFGSPPSRLRQHSPDDGKVGMQLEYMPAQTVLQIRYQGIAANQHRAKGVLAGHCFIAGAKRWRGWCALDREHPFDPAPQQLIDVNYFVSAAHQPAEVKGVERRLLPGGWYAVLRQSAVQRQSGWTMLMERVAEELGCKPLSGGRLLERDLNANPLRAPQERWTALYLPVIHC